MAKVTVEALTTTAGNYGHRITGEKFDMSEADAKVLSDNGTVKILGASKAADDPEPAKTSVNITDQTGKKATPVKTAAPKKGKK